MLTFRFLAPRGYAYPAGARRRRSAPVSLPALIVACGIGCAAEPAWPQPPPIPLFTLSSPSSSPSLAQDVAPLKGNARPWVRSRRPIALSTAALERLGSAGVREPVDLSIELPLLGTVTAAVRPQPRMRRMPSLRQVWTGVLKRLTDTDVTFVADGEVLTGSIRAGRIIFEIRPDDAGAHELVEIDTASLPSDHHPIPVSREELTAAEAALESSGQAGAPAVASDDGSTIDVMVVYTAAAKNANGGQNGIEALIDLGISLANTAFINSQINTQFRLVHVAEVDYAESGNYNTDLTRLRGVGDGFMDEIHGWRNLYKADLVALIEDNLGGACGVAYVMTNVSAGFAGWAFSVTQDSCISGYTLAHEWGHNMGSMHDRAEGGTGAYPYSFGHKEAGRFRTIMAYPCTPECTRINHFSNPGVSYQGSWATGVDHNADTVNSADNARAFGNALDTIANFRNSGDTVDTTPPPPPANLRIVDP